MCEEYLQPAVRISLWQFRGLCRYCYLVRVICGVPVYVVGGLREGRHGRITLTKTTYVMNEAHLHLTLVHGPVAGILFGVVLLAFALWRRNDLLARVSFVSFIVVGLLATMLYFTGEGAEEIVEGLAGVSHDVIEAHEEAAVWALWSSLGLGLVSLGGLLGYRRRNLPSWLLTTVFVGSLVVGGVIAWTANLGGQISHPEIRSDEQAVVQVQMIHTDRV